MVQAITNSFFLNSFRNPKTGGQFAPKNRGSVCSEIKGSLCSETRGSVSAFFPINRPTEAEGLELVEISEDLERLLIFESFIRFAKAQEHKLVSVVYKYSDYLLSQNANFTDFEIKYCHRRLNKEGCNYKIGFWYHRKKELEEKLKENIN